MPLMPCPECRKEISTHAKACPQCGFPLPASSSSTDVVLAETALPAGPGMVSGFLRSMQFPVPPSPLQEIAYRQRLLLNAVLMNILTWVPITYLPGAESPASPTSNHLLSELLSLLGLMIVLGVGCFSVWCYWKLGRSLRWPWPLLAFLAIGLFVPGLSLLLQISIVGWATNGLRKKGVYVGLMGADLSKVH